MPEVGTTKELLIDALQDLHDAERALDERLGKIVDRVRDGRLRAILGSYATNSSERARLISVMVIALEDSAEGATNIWMRGVLDDADRDTRTVAEGPLLDIALLGALRKGAQAARVSYETATALASLIDAGDPAGLDRLCATHADTDAQLAGMLASLTSDAAAA